MKQYRCPKCKSFMKKNGKCKNCGYTENKMLMAKTHQEKLEEFFEEE